MDEICMDDTLAVVRGHNGGWKISRLMWHPGSPTPR